MGQYSLQEQPSALEVLSDSAMFCIYRLKMILGEVFLFVLCIFSRLTVSPVFAFVLFRIFGLIFCSCSIL